MPLERHEAIIFSASFFVHVAAILVLNGNDGDFAPVGNGPIHKLDDKPLTVKLIRASSSMAEAVKKEMIESEKQPSKKSVSFTSYASSGSVSQNQMLHDQSSEFNTFFDMLRDQGLDFKENVYDTCEDAGDSAKA